MQINHENVKIRKSGFDVEFRATVSQSELKKTKIFGRILIKYLYLLSHLNLILNFLWTGG